MPRGHIPLSHRRYRWSIGSYPPRAFGIITGHIGTPIEPNIRIVPGSPTIFVFCRDILEAKGQFSAQGKYPGNEHLLWHGTTRACNLGESGKTAFCTNSRCYLCSIARGSFNVAHPKRHAWLRFGPGIYTSSKSSK